MSLFFEGQVDYYEVADVVVDGSDAGVEVADVDDFVFDCFGSVG